MKSGNVLFSGAQFIFAVCVIFLGAIFLGLEHFPYLRFTISRFFAESTVPFGMIGYTIMGGGIVLMSAFYYMHRGVYYQVGMGGAEVDPAVIQSYVLEYWKRVFPEQDLSVQVFLTKEQKIEMFVELPSLVDELETLKNAEGELTRILSKQLGYNKDFLLSVLVK